MFDYSSTTHLAEGSCHTVYPFPPAGVYHTAIYHTLHLHKIHSLLLSLLLQLGLLLRCQSGCLHLPHSWTCLKDGPHPTAEVRDASAVGGTKGEWVEKT